MERRRRSRALPALIAAACLGVLAAAPTPAFGADPAARAGSSLSPGDRAAIDRMIADQKRAQKKTPASSDRTPANVDAACDVPKSADQAICFAMRVKDVHGGKGLRSASDAPEGLSPSDLLSAYNLPADGGAGATIAVVAAYDNPRAEADLTLYREQFGLPPLAEGQLVKVNQRGDSSDYPSPESGWATEIALDLDMVSAVAPKAKIILVEADSSRFTDLGESVNTAVELGATYVSNSYGLPYSATSGTAEATDFTDLAERYYDHPGIAMVASSGDRGHGVTFPASASTVTSVGGTSLVRDGSTARGWREAAWAGAGSGCSAFAPKPAYQKDTGCDRRSVSDVSAVADPETGVAVYNTYGTYGGGWGQFGGTSAAAPIIAATYALAGPVAEGTQPAGYPYANPRLNDVTSGSNGSCSPAYLCNGAVGYDGPTGLGTPNGTAAFRQGPTGTLSGKVTDGAHKAMPGRVVTLADGSGGSVYSTKTDSDGGYRLSVSPGTYKVSVTLFGHRTATGTARVTAGKTAKADLVLVKLPTRKLSGKVVDGSGQGWPLYTKITFDEVPGGVFYTDRRTGAYAIELPSGTTYTMHAAPVYPGYVAPSATKVALSTKDVKRDISVKADVTSCIAPGYGYAAQADFEGWGSEARYGWSVSNAAGSARGWQFDQPGWSNSTGGTGDFATASPGLYGDDSAVEDTTLTSPAFDLSRRTDADLHFDTTMYDAYEKGATFDAAMSVDAGRTWTEVFRETSPIVPSHRVTVPLGAALGHSDVRLRFHFKGEGLSQVQIDNVLVGRCEALGGGLITGVVKDANTHRPLNGAKVTATWDPATNAYRTAVSAKVPGDARSDGSYWLYSPHAGRGSITTSALRYTTSIGRASGLGRVSEYNPALNAGQLKVTAGKVALGAALDGGAGQDITLTNTGHGPLTVSLSEQSRSTAAKEWTAPAGGAWKDLPGYPAPVQDNVTSSFEGSIYSVGGYSNKSIYAEGFVLAPGAKSWSRIARLPEPRTDATGAFLNGTLYVVGGYNFGAGHLNLPQSTTFAYHPQSNSWSRVADLPDASGSGSAAVLDGKLYYIGGKNSSLDDTKASYRYDAAHDTWSRIADYPIALTHGGCGGVTDAIVCSAGGIYVPSAKPDTTRTTELTAQTFAYSPKANTWRRVADMPYALAGASYSAANGKLQVVGGQIWGDTYPKLSHTVEYDPVTNSWATLAETPRWTNRGGHSTGCGLLDIGGQDNPTGTTTTGAAILTGTDQCAGDDVRWLSTSATKVTLAPGRSAKVRVTADARTLTAPGGYAAALSMIDNSPYRNAPVPVTLKATAPSSYTEITGTVTGGSRTKLPGAKITLSRGGKQLVTTTTNAEGVYRVWVKSAADKTTVTATNDGYAPSSQEVKTVGGGRATADFALRTQ
ncbi:carboxypeptidase regulatory-like domain-containing protein [Streptomyces sp. NPDC086010]|uniref:carboxypeptidase regulatory-like domain-containing protein n=1 Tax=Streptomyces sp. NPDC086010 TaxID=3365745 RepID=UPI0037D0EDBD